ncbi:FtsK/SpoIIIE domain-containing protein [Pseudonocardia oroxyli]|uniref:DNA segregation ATPase FtsK/SpoIIIE, S-DNA-T family n=1 Tax=Pseudonocardia oroxyli TaxID=366584 RepID=A0A1G7UFB9_PSEOR|nr:FtsK/SpoIIIE domain-containing protein [Pseudonocardia oroxyli]SDG45971.1 DNA segregation ATPase FtsK/SpoIIIE, S-DNA-T family [Pseudonocardia oroxyli]
MNRPSNRPSLRHHREVVRHSSRPVGGEFRGLAWLVRHPLFALVPTALIAVSVMIGAMPTAAALGLLALTAVVWGRLHPPSFDRWAAPTLRAFWRRWTTYRGRRWASVLADCGLARENPHTGRIDAPRVLRVRSATRSIDTLRVRLTRGQDLTLWAGRTETLADALRAHRVAVTRHRPGVLTIVVERQMPFTLPIPAPAIPADTDAVDLAALPVGQDEYGHPFHLAVPGRHVLVAGATGSGKGSLIWAPLRAMGPAIRDRLVRVHVIDLKGGAETQRGARLFHRHATTPAEAIALLTEVRDEMKARQAHMAEHGLRCLDLTSDTPLDLVMIDELAMLTAYGERADVREALRLLAEILTQGRACLTSVMGYVQEPSKDVVDVRELFPTRICLGVTASSHVDMVLGDGARERGALADEIPGDLAHAGIGYVIDQASRLPVRFRAALVTDDEIDELVARCAPPASPTLRAVDGEVA